MFCERLDLVTTVVGVHDDDEFVFRDFARRQDLDLNRKPNDFLLMYYLENFLNYLSKEE